MAAQSHSSICSLQSDQKDFRYPPAERSGLAHVSLAVFSDQADIRQMWNEDAESAQISIGEAGHVSDLLSGEFSFRTTDLIILDCHAVDAERMAQLSWLDMRVAQAGATLLVTTSMEVLDQIFVCFELAQPTILVNPSRPERVIALGAALAKMCSKGVREMSRDDRLMLLKLTEQVEHLAERLDTMSTAPDQASVPDDKDRLESPALAFNGQDSGSDNIVRLSRPPLPDPRLVRRIIRQRQLRVRFFESDMFADPAWEMLLDLTAARAEHARVSVTSLCIASGVPPTTALRWIAQMVDAGLFERVEDETDKRRAFIQLSDKAADAMARYFAELGREAAALV